jgi:hypothetical protein
MSFYARQLKVGAAIGVGLMSYFSVSEQEHAVLRNRVTGQCRTTIYPKGMHLKLPLVHAPVYFPLKLAPRTVNMVATTSDGEVVELRLRVLMRPSKLYLPFIAANLPDYPEAAVPRDGGHALRAVVATLAAADMIANRSKVGETLQAAVREHAAASCVEVADVSVVSMSFSPEFTVAAIERGLTMDSGQREVRFDRPPQLS